MIETARFLNCDYARLAKHPRELQKGGWVRVCPWDKIHSPRAARGPGRALSRMRMKTLITDDDDITRLMLPPMLTKLGHEVQQASNGRKALAGWQCGEILLIISHWMMSDREGLEFTAASALSSAPTSPVVFPSTARLAPAGPVIPLPERRTEFA